MIAKCPKCGGRMIAFQVKDISQGKVQYVAMFTCTQCGHTIKGPVSYGVPVKRVQ